MPGWTTLPLLSIALATDQVDPAHSNILGHALVTTKGTQTGGLFQNLDRHDIVQSPAPIPKESSAIHGITDQAASWGVTPAEAITAIRQRLLNAPGPVIAFNAPWVFATLDNACASLNVEPIRPGLIIDPLVLDKANISRIKSGGRRLPAMCDRYNVDAPATGAHVDAAHSAGELAHAIITSIPKCRNLNPEQLSQACAHWYMETENEFRDFLRSQGTTPDNPITPWPSADLPVAS